MKASSPIKIALSTGLALFAMFFGAGNIIFPLQLGVHAGQHTVISILGFILTGVGFPFLGLFAISLYEGSYWNFFRLVSKPIAFLIIFFLIFVLCLTVGTPRTEMVTYDTWTTHFPVLLHHSFLFSLIYFSLVFLVVCNQSRIIDIIGWFLSPVKIIAFALLIIVAIHAGSPFIYTHHNTEQQLTTSITTGYSTMDLLAAILFCTVAYKNIVKKCHQNGLTDKRTLAKITLLSCSIAAFFIAMIYAGLIIASAMHAAALQNTATPALIGKLSLIVLGKYGFAFVAICVSFACLATAAALTEAAVDFFYVSIFSKRVPRIVCLLGTLSVMLISTSYGFKEIMGFAIPILTVLYPVLIFLCILNIARKILAKNIPMQI